MKKIIAVAITFLALMAAPLNGAVADETPPTNQPYANDRYVSDGHYDVQIAGQYNTWGLQPQAKVIAKRVGPKLRLHFVKGACLDKYDTCIRITTYRQRNTIYEAWTSYTWKKPGYRISHIKFNLAKRTNYRWVATHEFLHGLGMLHHRQRGIMYVNTRTPRAWATEQEIRVLRNSIKVR